MNVMPAAASASAKCAFSDRKPNPGCTASAPVRWHAVDDRGDIEVGRNRRRPDELDRFVGFAHGEALRVDRVVDGDARYAQLAQRADDPHRDFAAVGDQHFGHFFHESLVSGSVQQRVGHAHGQVEQHRRVGLALRVVAQRRDAAAAENVGRAGS